MLDLKRLERNEDYKERPYQEAYRQDLKNRNSDATLVDQILEINTQRKKLIADVEEAKAQQNKVGQEIAQLKKKKEDASRLLEKMQRLSASIKEKEKIVHPVEEELYELLLTIPNHLHPDVPEGKDEKSNRLEKTVGEPTPFNFEAKDHIVIGENLKILDFERGAKVAGARFAFLRGAGSRLERALIQFMLDTHIESGDYEETIPPFVVNSNSLIGTGQFPKFKEDVFHLEGFDYYLVPTAEVPVTNFFRDEILIEEDLPLGFCAYSPCFRSEAGSYGKDTKGLIRQHQFNKVKLLKFCRPETSYEEHEKLTRDAESILEKLELPYRRMCLCSGDVSFSAAKCYDLEVWLPGQQSYREISSCSNFEDFQARRANIRFRLGGKGKPQFVHTLNGSGLAVGRTLIAILENYQREDGRVSVPKVLRPYMGGKEIIGVTAHPPLV